MLDELKLIDKYNNSNNWYVIKKDKDKFKMKHCFSFLTDSNKNDYIEFVIIKNDKLFKYKELIVRVINRVEPTFKLNNRVVSFVYNGGYNSSLYLLCFIRYLWYNPLWISSVKDFNISFNERFFRCLSFYENKIEDPIVLLSFCSIFAERHDTKNYIACGHSNLCKEAKIIDLNVYYRFLNQDNTKKQKIGLIKNKF